MARKPFFSEREVRLARSFIKAIHGNDKNGYLLLAVIAWQRAMTRSHDTFWKTLNRYTAFRAGQLLAAKLKARAGLDAAHYTGVLASLRRAGKTSGYVKQARDFMLAIQLSNWDKKHYGYRAEVAEGYWKAVVMPNRPGERDRVWVPPQPEYDPLAIIWSKLTGHNIPKAYFIDRVVAPKPPKPPPAPPRQPRSLIHVLPKKEYILPYAARSFYDARPHLGEYVLEAD